MTGRVLIGRPEPEVHLAAAALVAVSRLEAVQREPEPRQELGLQQEQVQMGRALHQQKQALHLNLQNPIDPKLPAPKLGL